jgi:hypothetical protein
MVISMSGTLGWGSIGSEQAPGQTMIDRYAAAGLRSTALYLDSGGSGTCVDGDADGIADDGDDSDNYCVTQQLRDVLLGLGYELGVDLWYEHVADAPHNEAAWAARVDVPMALFAAL